MRKKYYENSLIPAIVFAVVFFLAIVLGIIIRNVAPDFGNVSLALLCIGIPLEIFAIVIMIASMVRNTIISEDRIELLATDNRHSTRKQTILFNDVRAITTKHYEGHKPNFICVLLTALLLNDALVEIKGYDEYTFHMKNGIDLYARFDAYSKKNRKEILEQINGLLNKKAP